MRKYISDYILVTFILALLCILIRVYEYAYVIYNHIESVSLHLFFARSVNYDTLFVFWLSLLLLIPYILLYYIKKELGLIFIRLSAMLMILIKLALIQYFLTNNSLLSSVLFDFSFREILHIITGEFSSGRLVFWLSYLFFIPLSVYVLFYPVRKIRLPEPAVYVLLTVYLTASVITIANKKHCYKSLKYFDTKYQYLLGNNEFIYFLKSLRYENDLAFQVRGFSKKEIDAKTKLYQSFFPDLSFINTDYPLVHADPGHNVLGKYFNSSATKPNIVIIISESLSSSYCGANARLGHLTPFTDSLIRHSLYWENFFSNADRTYGVLPGILASLSAGTNARGFINMEVVYPNNEKYPHYLNLVQLLKQNGYYTGYFYGGWGYFDNIVPFMRNNKTDLILHDSLFDSGKYKKGTGKSGEELVWGYNDKDLFNQSFDYINNYQQGIPFLSICQTLTFHSPYNLIDKSYLDEKYLNLRLKNTDIPKDIMQKISKEVIASAFFADDALRDLFDLYKKLPGYENTIFIITGDHANNFNIQNRYFEEYLVPLIIYSPLLDHPAKFKGVCSHIDILPSLLDLLKNNYGLTIPPFSHWIGMGLDTSSNFNSCNIVPLNIFGIESASFIFRNQLILSGKAYSLDSNLEITPEKDTNRMKELFSLFDAYKFINNYVCFEDKIWDTLLLNIKQKK